MQFNPESLLAVKGKPIDRVYIVREGVVNGIANLTQPKILHEYLQGDVIGLV